MIRRVQRWIISGSAVTSRPQGPGAFPARGVVGEKWRLTPPSPFRSSDSAGSAGRADHHSWDMNVHHMPISIGAHSSMQSLAAIGSKPS